jgi:5'-3' exonuclease
MGIPAYFSHILKEHANILISQQQLETNIDRLYMDCNSIIYDSYRELLKNGNPTFVQIIEHVIQSINNIIQSIQPTKTTLIAFDGVAPFAKMKQQKQRRLRNVQPTSQSNVTQDPVFDTCMITPGTQFMKELSTKIELAYKSNKSVIVSTSNEHGEGEHKMMEHYRANVTSKDTVAIYGLDSDLIMLAVFHYKQANRLYVFREAPEFFKSKIPIEFRHPKEPYFVDIPLFVSKIHTEYNMSPYDYVFLCFLLGNDFLPHFPTLNLRTRGIQVIQDVYHNLLDKYKPMIKEPTQIPQTKKRTKNQTTQPIWQINWSNFYYFIRELAKIEHELFTQEFTQRERQERRYFPETTDEERETSLQHVPQQYRSKELYIDPNTPGWESRYYRVLFEGKHDPEPIARNYLEGLEWVFYYYTSGCVNWSWSYKYHYPPLFKDLLQYMENPTENTTMTYIEQDQTKKTQQEQMNYVLPALSKWKEGLITYEEYQELHKKEQEFTLDWAFCKYLWEAHINDKN